MLTVFLALPCLNLMWTRAATRIETERRCSLTVSLDVAGSAGSQDAYRQDFEQMVIPVSVYKVADVDVTGQRYTPTDNFTGMDFTGLMSDHEAAAAVWNTLAEEAAAMVDPDTTKDSGNTEVKMQDAGISQGKVADLDTGLYLVMPGAVFNPDYTVRYTFMPYLTALPSSEYTLTGSGSDEWNYDTVVGLKPDGEHQFGRLNITKSLLNYNETLGPTTFVFRIKGVDRDGITRYEEVESMTFSAAGSENITLEQIPAGLMMTVTEEYSGASYEYVGSNEEQVLIWSEEAVLVGAGPEASVTFENRYGGGSQGGYGVTNHFESDGAGGWMWENPTASPEE